MFLCKLLHLPVKRMHILSRHLFDGKGRFVGKRRFLSGDMVEAGCLVQCMLSPQTWEGKNWTAWCSTIALVLLVCSCVMCLHFTCDSKTCLGILGAVRRFCYQIIFGIWYHIPIGEPILKMTKSLSGFRRFPLSSRNNMRQTWKSI